jgi:hypothetical protein
MKSCPIFGGLRGNEMEVAGKHANDGVGISVERDGLAENVGAAAVALLPCCVAENRGARSGEQIFTGCEVATEDGSDAEDTEKTVADAAGADGLDAILGGEREAAALVEFESGEDFVAFFPVVVVGDREIALLKQRDGFEDADEAIGVAIRKRFEKSGVDEREDGDAGGHAEREHENCGDGEAEIFAELAEGETKILERRLKPEADDVAAAIAEMKVVAEFAIGGVSGVLRG